MALEITRVSTGISKLDKILNGGFPLNSSILLNGTPGLGKSIFCQQFIYTGLKIGEKCIFVSFDVRPETISNSMARFGWETKSKPVFFDCFSYRIGQQSVSRYAVTGLSDLNQMSMIFEDILNDLGNGRKRIVVDSLSTLLLYSDSELAMKFLKDFLATAISQNATLLMTVEEGIHDEKTIATINYMVDGFLEMKFDMDKRFMRVLKMCDTPVSREWLEYDVRKKGIIII